MIPLVSIIIPAYNSERWIKATIESAIAQTCKNKEIIVVDDGSTDETYNIAKMYESKILKVLSQKNSGACVARNKALSVAQGDFIQWLDSDDILNPHKIETQLNESDRDPQSKVLHSSAWGYFYYNIKRAKFQPNGLWKTLTPTDWIVTRFNEGRYFPPITWLVSRKLTEVSGPWNDNLLRDQDGEYFCRVIASSELVLFHPEAICYYRKGNFSSISGSPSREKIESLKYSHHRCIDNLLILENSEITRRASCNYLDRFNNKIYFAHPDIVRENYKKILELGGEVLPPKKSKKYELFKKHFGIELTRKLKMRFWRFEIYIDRNWDRFLSLFFKDSV